MQTVLGDLATQSHFTWVLAVCASHDGRFIFTGSVAAGPIEAKQGDKPSSTGLCCARREIDIEEGNVASGMKPEDIGNYAGLKPWINLMLCTLILAHHMPSALTSPRFERFAFSQAP